MLIPCLQYALQHLLNSIEAGGIDVSNVNADVKQLLMDVRDVKVCNPNVISGCGTTHLTSWCPACEMYRGVLRGFGQDSSGLTKRSPCFHSR